MNNVPVITVYGAMYDSVQVPIGCLSHVCASTLDVHVTKKSPNGEFLEHILISN